MTLYRCLPLFAFFLIVMVEDASAQYVGPWKITHNYRIYGKDSKPIAQPEYRVAVDTSAAGVGFEDPSAPFDIRVNESNGRLDIEYYSSRSYTPRFSIDHGSERMTVQSDFSLDSIPFRAGFYRAPLSYQSVFADQARYHSRRLSPIITDFPSNDTAHTRSPYERLGVQPEYGRIETQRLWSRPKAPYGLGQVLPALSNHGVIEGVYAVPQIGVIVLVRNTMLSEPGTPPTSLLITKDRGVTWRTLQMTSSRDSIYQPGSNARAFNYVDSLGTRHELWLTDSGTVRITPGYVPAAPHISRPDPSYITVYSSRRRTMYSRIEQQVLESRDTGMSWRPIFSAGPMRHVAWKDTIGAYFTSQYWAVTRDDGESWYATPFSYYPSYFTDAIVLDRKTVVAYGPECIVFVDFKD